MKDEFISLWDGWTRQTFWRFADHNGYCAVAWLCTPHAQQIVRQLGLEVYERRLNGIRMLLRQRYGSARLDRANDETRLTPDDFRAIDCEVWEQMQRDTEKDCEAEMAGV